MLNGMYRTCITHVCILSGDFSGLQGFFQDIHDFLSSDTGVSQNPHTKWLVGRNYCHNFGEDPWVLR